MGGDSARILLICQLDGFANGVKPREMERHLVAKGHNVDLVDTFALSRASERRDSPAHKLPHPSPRRAALWGLELAARLTTRREGLARRTLSGPLFLAQARQRRRILARRLPLDDYDLVVCAVPHDAEVLKDVREAVTLYDCPTPFADELLYEGRLTAGQHVRLRKAELDLYASVDHLAFWWTSYADHVVESYGYAGNNLLRLDYGCWPSPRRAAYASPARIAYLGSLSSRFIDVQLLSRLARAYPHVDVFGGPPPDSSLGLRYFGHADPDVLADYQFGLVTSTDDELRRNGFSAKHLQYLAYGLPVLVPAWRRHLDRLAGSVPYEEHSFTGVVAAASRPDEWRRLSDAAYRQAQDLSWDRTLAPLDELLRRAARRP